VYNSLQIVRAASWKGPYTVFAENVALGGQGGEDPFLWVDGNEHFHLLYHRMNDGLQIGGHARCSFFVPWSFAIKLRLLSCTVLYFQHEECQSLEER
jgi:hypothetical protein